LQRQDRAADAELRVVGMGGDDEIIERLIERSVDRQNVGHRSSPKLEGLDKRRSLGRLEFVKSRGTMLPCGILREDDLHAFDLGGGPAWRTRLRRPRSPP